MSNLPTKKEFDDLKNELNSLKAEYNQNKNNEQISTEIYDPVERVFSSLIENGIEIFKLWNNTISETRKYEIDKNIELEKHKLQIFSKVGNIGFIIKFLIVFITLGCIIWLSLVDKLQPELSVIFAVILTSAFGENIINIAKNIYQGFTSNKNQET